MSGVEWNGMIGERVEWEIKKLISLTLKKKGNSKYTEEEN